MKNLIYQNSIYFAFIILVSCNITQKTQIDINKHKPFLGFISQYKTSAERTTLGTIEHYDQLKLKRISNDTTFTLLLNEYPVITKNSQYRSLYEIFKDSFLVMPFTNRVLGAAGPDLFERDSMLVLDLHTSDLVLFTLENVYFVRSKTSLQEYYYHSDEEKPWLDLYCAIKSIDLSNSSITVYIQYNQNLKVKTFYGKKLSKPYYIGQYNK